MQIIALDPTTPQLRAPPSGSTYAAPRAIVMTPEALTGSTATSSLSIAQTWNTTGTPTAFNLNVTDTASNASSLLMDLRVGGASQFRVTKGARTTASSWEADVGYLSGFTSVAAAMARTFTQRALILDSGGGAGTGVYLPSYGSYNFTASGSGADVSVTADLRLVRDAANTLAQRNGVNAQVFRVYNTFTDASNYERGVMSWTSNDLKIGVENAGTGVSSRQMHLYSGGLLRFYTNNTHRWSVDASGNFVAGTDNTLDIGASGASRPRNVFQAGYWQTSEMTAPAAPAANGVRIYAQDNGAGKTQLMALFATGAAQQIAIEP